MPKELFDQPLIKSPDLPDDDLRISFGKPGVQGGFNVLWVYFKQLIQGALNFLALIPQDPAPTEAEGVFYYDDVTKAYSAYTHITGVAPYRFGRTLRSRVLNNTGSIILKGDTCKIVGLSGIFPVVEKSQANTLKDVQTSIGMALNDIPAGGGEGLLAVFDTIIGVDTSGMTVNDLIYLDPDNPGKFVNVRPNAPNYALPIGFVAIVDAVNGVAGVRFGGFDGSDTSVNSEGTLNGMVTQTPDIAFSVSGGIIYADIINELFPTKNLPFLLDFERYLLDVTTNTGLGGAARVVIPPGGDPSLAEAAQKSWIYVFLNGGNPDIAISTNKPSVPHAIIGTVVAYNAATTLARGNVHGYRRENNASSSESEGIPGTYGFTRVIADDARSRGSAWDSGQDATPDVDDLTIQLALSAGIGKQLHYSNVPLFDGLLYQVYNDETDAIVYEEVANLVNILLDANGNTLLGNGFYYTFRFYYKLNSNGIGNDVVVTRPKGHYSSGELAESDALKYTTALADTNIEDIVYPLYDMVIGRTGGGGTTVAMFSLTSLRSKTPGAGGGSGSGAATTDDKVRASAADTTNDYLTAKITVTGALKTIINPGGNEILDFKVHTMYTPGGTIGAVYVDSVGKVGIGTTLPTQQLEVRKDQNAETHIKATNATAGTASAAGLVLQGQGNNFFFESYSDSHSTRAQENWIETTAGTTDLVLATAGGEAIRIDSAGGVGINDSSIGEKLEVGGNIKATDFLLSSDKRLKKNIKSLNTLDKILALEVVEFEWRKNAYNKKKNKVGKDFGLIAQDVEKIIPEIVSTGKDGYKSIGYSRLGVLAIDGVKELHRKLIEKSEKIDELRYELHELKARFDKLEKLISNE